MLPTGSSWEGQTPKHVSVPLAPNLTDVFSIYRSHFRATTLRLYRHYLVILSNDGRTLLVYSLPDCSLLYAIKKYWEIQEFHVYGNTLVLVMDDRIIHVYDLTSGECVNTIKILDLNGWEPENNFVHILKPELVYVEKHGIRTKEKWPKKPLLVWFEEYGPFLRVWELAFSSRKRVSAPTMNKKNSLRFLRDINAPNHIILCYASRGRTIMTGGLDQSVRVWDVLTGECLWVLLGHTRKVRSGAIDDRQAYSMAFEDAVRIWTLKTGDCLHIIRLDSPLPRISLTPSFSYLSIWETHRGLSIWDTKSGKLHNHFYDTGPPSQIDDRKVMTTKEEKLLILDIHSNQLLHELLIDHGPEEGYLIRGARFRGRYCSALVEWGSTYSIELWEFADEDGWVEDEFDADADENDYDNDNQVSSVASNEENNEPQLEALTEDHKRKASMDSSRGAGKRLRMGSPKNMEKGEEGDEIDLGQNEEKEEEEEGDAATQELADKDGWAQDELEKNSDDTQLGNDDFMDDFNDAAMHDTANLTRIA